MCQQFVLDAFWGVAVPAMGLNSRVFVRITHQTRNPGLQCVLSSFTGASWGVSSMPERR